LKKHNIHSHLTHLIGSLYENTSCGVLVDSNIGDWFHTTVGVRQGCLPSPCLFNIFLEQIMTEALESFEGNVRIGGRSINNLRFADDIDLIAGSMTELAELTEQLEKSASAFGMDISSEKSKIMVTPATNENNTNIPITVNDSKLQSVKIFKNLGSNVTEDGTSVCEVKTRLAIATQHLSKLKKIWSSKNISKKTKMNLLRSVVISTALYGCESWTLTANLEKRIAAFEIRCFRRLLQIPCIAHSTNISVTQEVTSMIGEFEPLIQIVRRLKLQWFGHVSRHTDSLANTIMQGSLSSKRTRGRPKTSWIDNIHSWTGLSHEHCLRNCWNRNNWQTIVHAAKAPQRPLAMGMN